MPGKAPQSWTASSLQRAMLLASLKGGAPPPYHLQLVLDIGDGVTTDLLRAAWVQTVRRHSGLLTQFRFDGAQLFQYEDPALEIAWHECECTPGVLDREYHQPFQLESAEPLWRVLLARDDSGKCLWSFTCHHAVMDWASYPALLSDWFAAYMRLPGGSDTPALDSFPVYREWAKWRESLPGANREAFWKERLAGFEAPTPLAHVFAAPGPVREAPAQRRERVEITPVLHQALRARAEELGVSTNALVMTAWALWLSLSTGEGHVLFGVMRACRGGDFADAGRVVGPLLASLPLAIQVPGSGTTAALIGEVHERSRALREFEHTPLDAIHQWSGFGAGEPLFRSAVNFQREPFVWMFDSLRAEAIARFRSFRQETDLPITISACEQPNLTVELVYRAELVQAEYVRHAAKALAVILEFLSMPGAQPLERTPLLPPVEREQVLAFSAEPCVTPEHASGGIGPFERAAKSRPDAVALESGTRAWTYGSLDEAANGIARGLLANGARPEDVVGIVMPPGPELVVSMLGILKSGAAFFVLNPDSPGSTKRSLLSRAGVCCVVASEEASAGEIPDNVPRFTIAELATAGRASRHALVAPQPGHLAYLVHTSGSTGEAKLIEIEHASLGNFLDAIIPIYGIGSSDRRLQRAAPGSDYFIAEVLVTLSAGAALVFADTHGASGIAEFVKALERNRITVTGIPGSYWHEWVRALDDGHSRVPPALRLVITGMEKIEAAAVRGWRSAVGGAVRWLNVYGPSEATAVATVYELSGPLPGEGDSVPIGKPLPNTRAYVLSRTGSLIPPGFEGEIFLGGAGIMRGYRGAESGIAADPFAPDAAGRLYRTGDFGYWLPDGNLVFVGRRDNQVKIRGHRVELEAVEAALSRAAGGAIAAVVAVQRAGQTALAAFVESERALDEQALRAALRASLHPAMIPQRIVTRDRLPRLQNGKLDRRALQTECINFDAPCAPAVTARATPEQAILSAFREVLGNPALSPEDDFLSSGGDSLAAVRAVLAIESTLGWAPPLQSFYEAGSARQLAAQFARGVIRGIVACRPLGPMKTAAPLQVLVVPPVNGIYRKLLLLERHWKSSVPLWALEQEPPSPDPAQYPIPLLARNYARAIADQFAGSSVLLAGYSSGALMAWEIARCLDGSRVRVGGVLLIEPTTLEADEAGRLVRLDRGFVKRGLAGNLALYARHTRMFAAIERIRFFAELARRFARNRTRRAPSPLRDEGAERWRAYREEVCRACEPGKLHATAHLLRGQDILLGRHRERFDDFWRSRSLGFHAHELCGNHYQIMAEPEVRVTARVMQRIAGEAAAARS